MSKQKDKNTKKAKETYFFGLIIYLFIHLFTWLLQSCLNVAQRTVKSITLLYTF